MNRYSRFLFIIVFIFSPFFVLAKTTTAIVNGNWTAGGTWDNGVPAAGDIIIIPVGITVSVTGGVIDLRGGTATIINISGSLDLSLGAIIRIDATLDVINILAGGSVNPIGILGGSILFGPPGFSILIINNFIGTSGPVSGPATITNGTLPITLISFDAKVSNDKVDLTWITASELNNDFFTIERSSDAESFEEILTRKGNGTTNEENTYVETDLNPIIGRSYYRLKQTDFNGTTTYSDLVTVAYEGPVFATLHTFPNPSLGTTLTLQLKGVKEVMDVPVVMVSMQGEIVFEGILHVDETGKATQEVEFQQKLASGLYVVKAGPSVFLTQKVSVIR